ncbi:hypothetical protein D3C73_949300 [compost metagenome]
MQRVQLRDIRQIGDRFQDNIDRNSQQVSDPDPEQSREGTDNAGLGIEDTRDILLPGAQGAEHTDFLSPFKDGDIGDDPDHNQGYDQ